MIVRPEWNVTWAHVRDSDTRFAVWESPSCAAAVVRPVGRSGLAFQILAQDCAHAPAMVPVVIGELLHGSDAEKVATDLLAEFRRRCTIDGVDMPLSASIGIALYPDHGTEGAQLWRSADIAMYRAKYSGGNRYLVVSEEDSVATKPDKVLHRASNGGDRS